MRLLQKSKIMRFLFTCCLIGLLFLLGCQKEEERITENAPREPYSIEIQNLPKSFMKDDQVTLNVEVRDTLGKRVTPEAIQWQSSDTEVATITKQGVLVGEKEGSVVITVKVLMDKMREKEVELEVTEC